MPIRKRGFGWQVDVKHKGNRIRETIHGSKDLALARESEIKAQLYRGEPIVTESKQDRRGGHTLREAFEQAKLQWKNTKAERTSVGNAERVLSFFGDNASVSSIDRDAVARYVKHLDEDKGNSSSTINRKLTALRVLLRTAHEHEWIDRIPRLPKLKERKHRVVCYSPAEELKILETLRSLGYDRQAYLVEFLIDTGLRVSEAQKLKWAQVHEDAVEVLDSKNGENRRVPLTKRASRAIKMQPTGRFQGPFGGLDYESHIRTAWANVRTALNRQEDEQFVLHGLRHTFCSRLVQRGVQLQVVKELAGHKCLQTTLRYAHLAPSNLMDAVALLE
jgi:integrase